MQLHIINTPSNISVMPNQENIIKLSEREHEVLKLLSLEYSTKEIASTLFLSKSTIESHRRTLLLKLQAKNSAGLIRKAFEVGLLHVEKTKPIENL